ncbi:unnamed protein product [Ambrosiozyma monospora]|uniref:Unnamed protein product n=1 Tax=Ambrosiozyma monospora TaxID=43982 RepID=A0ACB5SZV8_AMBMO|nr:unnamed protein product [Ambrosiozyma monospora]
MLKTMPDNSSVDGELFVSAPQSEVGSIRGQQQEAQQTQQPEQQQVPQVLPEQQYEASMQPPLQPPIPQQIQTEALPQSEGQLPPQVPPQEQQQQQQQLEPFPSEQQLLTEDGFPYGDKTEADLKALRSDPYNSYTSDETLPISAIRIKEIFRDLRDIFGFQNDSMENMHDHLMTQLDSRSSRVAANLALSLLHSDYIGGHEANYRKWYFCSQLQEDTELIENIDLKGLKKKNAKKFLQDITEPEFHPSRKIDVVEYRWRVRMRALTPEDMVYQLALYLLIWGEANNIRFMPECLCFIFKCALDYLDYKRKQPPAPPDETQRFPEKHFLIKIITPLYNYMRDQQFKLVKGKYIRRERDHQLIIGYDDINQLFWYEKGMRRIKLKDKTKLLDKPLHERYENLENVNWKKAFYKTYREKRTWWHLATNFSRIWVIHFSVFWYYSSFNSPAIYTYKYEQTLDNRPLTQDTLSVVSFGGTIACIVQLLATIAESSFVPHRWPGKKNLFIRSMVRTMLNMTQPKHLPRHFQNLIGKVMLSPSYFGS